MKKKIARSTTGLMGVLFEEIENLISGKSNPQVANSKVALSKAIIGTKRLEIDSARFVGNEKRDVDDLKEVSLGD